MKKNILLLINIVILVLFFSCDAEVALGPPINLLPPETVIIEPVNFDNCKEDISITGTSSDRDLITVINVSVENIKKDTYGNPLPDYWKIEYQGINGLWRVREQNGTAIGNWESFDNAKWDGVNFVEWEVRGVPLSGKPQGEYLISAGSINDVYKEGALAQVRVIIDNEPPRVTINLPLLTEGIYSEIENVFLVYQPFIHSHLEKLHNTRLRVQYEVDDEFSIHSVRLELRDRDGKLYYDSDDKAPAASSGNLTINANEIIDPDTGYPLNKRVNLRFVSYASDRAENEGESNKGETIGSHGWFIWDPDADKPWSEGLGEETAATIYNTRIYSGSPMYGQAYDNEGVDRIEYVIWQSATFIGTDNFTVKADEGVLYNVPLQEGDDPSGFFQIKIPNAPIPELSPTKEANYLIVVTTFDIEGLSHENKFFFRVFIPETAPPLFRGFDPSPSPGIYGIGAVIDITILFRESVTLDNTASAYLTLNFIDSSASAPARAVYKAGINTGNATSGSLTFTYTVKDGDSVPILNVESHSGLDPSNLKKGSPTGGGPLMEPNVLDINPSYNTFTRVEINTDVPVLQSITPAQVNDDDKIIITLTFSKEIVKGSGNIEIIHENSASNKYIAPAVLSRNEWLSLNSNARGYYYKGTNGALVASSGGLTADTAEKYILNYSLSAEDTLVVSALIGTPNNKHKLTIPITNEAVDISSDNKSLIITLSEDTGFVLPVKGVKYYVNYGLGIVEDIQNNKVPALSGNTYNFDYNGVNPVYFRLRRTEDLSDSDRFDSTSTAALTTRATVIAKQPYRTQFKIDCQTPGAAIKRSDFNTSVSQNVVTDFSSAPTAPVLNSRPATIETDYSRNAPVDLGPASTNDATDRNGYIYHIAARATLGTYQSDIAYLKATRSVIQYTTFNSTQIRLSTGGESGTQGIGPLRDHTATFTLPNERLQLWIRGGDKLNGENSTPGFPISWDVRDTAGAALLTTDENVNLTSASGQVWYWISWDVNATAYFRFLAGTTVSGVNVGDAKLGPRRWVWCQDRYDTCYEDYALPPGGSVSLNRTTTTPNMQSNSELMFRYEFVDKRTGL